MAMPSNYVLILARGIALMISPAARLAIQLPAVESNTAPKKRFHGVLIHAEILRY